MLPSPIKRLAALLALVALFGGGTTSAALAGHHLHRHLHGIPQHNGGDHDADNNGGPSDGDGSI